MIQEVFGGNVSNHTAAEGLSVGKREASLPPPTGVLQSSSTTTTTTTNPKPSSENSNPLRCPRCDSSNTKFCYYNNYNLTQPRHFCKTCRRYWTKGGALRNVPIGGGCRKNNKANISHAISSALEKPTTGKYIRSHILTSENMLQGKASSAYLGGSDHGGLSTHSLLWTSPQTSHLLALLRSNQAQNPDPNYDCSNIINSVKEEGPFLNGSGGFRLDPYSNNLNNQQQSGGFIGQNLNNQDQVCDQRASFKSAENYYSDNYAAANLLMGSGHTPSANCSDILESTPVLGGGHQLVGCWNNASLSRPELPTTDGAYH
ncbi:hypothetical protein DCAR_0312410 [Daucus carota subsp. sativus]|uniref:Dof zinc finger protein n=1 Tax=Daucus carota subsp. sativus TaxID=79200 RepID=A0A161XZD0_DAUCS|nr:PREDICTED: dof zinc finger protein DOF2.1-like [Daucus carota subsp. sativus]WOG93129.1 hypothetical protein DCAR_0312410 [Daucus carota subsp. sativus]